MKVVKSHIVRCNRKHGEIRTRRFSCLIRYHLIWHCIFLEASSAKIQIIIFTFYSFFKAVCNTIGITFFTGHFFQRIGTYVKLCYSENEQNKIKILKIIPSDCIIENTKAPQSYFRFRFVPSNVCVVAFVTQKSQSPLHLNSLKN